MNNCTDAGELQKWISILCGTQKGGLRGKMRLMEAAISSARDTLYPWFMACDANMEPGTSYKASGLEKTMIIQVPAADVSTCRPR